MRNMLVCLAVASVFGTGCISLDVEEDIVTQTVDVEIPSQVLRHVVMFQFKDSATPADIRSVENAFAALPSKIPTIHDFEWGTDVSPEGLADGFTHCFTLTFLSEADRAVYLPHPEHKRFGTILGPHIDKVIVLDYWTKG